jgi:hypothetical protein
MTDEEDIYLNEFVRYLINEYQVRERCLDILWNSIHY